MAKHKMEVGGGNLGIKTSVNTLYSEATCKRFAEDAIFLYGKGVNTTDELEKKRYSRIAMTLIPFYLECLSNYLYDDFINVELNDTDKRNGLPKLVRMLRAAYKCLKKELRERKMNGINKVDNRTDLPIPLRRFRAVYKKCLNKELNDKDINGIRDIFTIRNKITAHPQGRSLLVPTDNGRKRDEININNLKLKDIPSVYSHFYPKHIHLVFAEVHDFLKKYVTVLKNNLTNEQYKYIWPEDLINWKSHNPSPPPQ